MTCPCKLPNDLMGFCLVRNTLMPSIEIKKCIESEQYRELLNVKHENRISTIGGPGTELSNILKKFGIKPTNNCNCEHYAKHMDAKGISWCWENIDTIVGWLEFEAKKRHLPFSKIIAKRLIKVAINRYKRKISKNGV